MASYELNIQSYFLRSKYLLVKTSILVLFLKTLSLFLKDLNSQIIHLSYTLRQQIVWYMRCTKIPEKNLKHLYEDLFC